MPLLLVIMLLVNWIKRAKLVLFTSLCYSLTIESCVETLHFSDYFPCILHMHQLACTCIYNNHLIHKFSAFKYIILYPKRFPFPFFFPSFLSFCFSGCFGSLASAFDTSTKLSFIASFTSDLSILTSFCILPFTCDSSI